MQNEKGVFFHIYFPNSLKLHGFPARLMDDGKIGRVPRRGPRRSATRSTSAVWGHISRCHTLSIYSIKSLISCISAQSIHSSKTICLSMQPIT